MPNAAMHCIANQDQDAGVEIYSLMRRLWPICRSITGDGFRQSLEILREYIPALVVYEKPTGSRCFDWVVPKEWNIRGASIVDPDGNTVVSFANSNLHVVSYSIPIDLEIDLEDLQQHLHSLPTQPDAIPYVTSYYKETWGFCLAHRLRETLRPGRYRVHIDSDLSHGSLTYGELILPGSSNREILVSSYLCHPSMANNELSGPCVTTMLARWLQTIDRRYTYRIVIVPETIGAICYLSENIKKMQQLTLAGFVMTCVGDDRAWSFMPSPNGDTYSDKVAKHVLKHVAPDYRSYSFLDRGSDERQYCSPGVDLPVVSIMRSKYATYPEYHTSLDNMDFVSPAGLQNSLEIHKRVIETIENDYVLKNKVICEPKMSDRGLRPTTGKVGSASSSRTMMNLLAYADGRSSLLDIAEKINVPAWELKKVAETLQEAELIEIVTASGS
jgi:aminopeptidase-like protein